MSRTRARADSWIARFLFTMWGRPSWDIPQAAAPAVDPGSGPLHWDSEEEEEEQDQNISQEQASREFADMLIDLKTKGRLSARDVCVLSFYAKHAGLQGPACDFAFRPSAPTGHFQRHLDSSLGGEGLLNDAYTLAVPSYDKYSLSRVVLDIPALPLHEALQAELDATPGLHDRLRASFGGRWGLVGPICGTPSCARGPYRRRCLAPCNLYRRCTFSEKGRTSCILCI